MVEVDAGTGNESTGFVTRQRVQFRSPTSGAISRAKVSSDLFCAVFACSDPLRRPGLFRPSLGFESLGLLVGIIFPFASRFLPPILGSSTDDDDTSY